MKRSNLDWAADAHARLPELKAQRDRWIVAASREGHSHDAIAQRLGLTRQSVGAIIRSDRTEPPPGPAPAADVDDPPSVVRRPVAPPIVRARSAAPLRRTEVQPNLKARP